MKKANKFLASANKDGVLTPIVSLAKVPDGTAVFKVSAVLVGNVTRAPSITKAKAKRAKLEKKAAQKVETKKQAKTKAVKKSDDLLG